MRAVSADPTRETRLALRQLARQLMRAPANAAVLRQRVLTALGMPGVEPVQGALADLFVALGVADQAHKRQALAEARERLVPHVVRWFEAQVDRPALSRITPLATRWSVLARPSADISTRARRCSSDDSRALAAAVLVAVTQADRVGQQAFLHHCMMCRDNLAFMLARRALLKSGGPLPEGWHQVSQSLEQAGALI